MAKEITQKQIEDLARKILKEFENDPEEEYTWEDALDAAKWELQASANGREYVTDGKVAEKKIAKTEGSTEKKPRKVDTQKETLLGYLAEGLSAHEIASTKENEVRLHFEVDGVSFTVTLTRHNKKK